jgi:hypothetical protein
MQTFTGKQYLEIDIANSFGLDKEEWGVRLAWFDTNRATIESAPFEELLVWAQQAEEPAQFLAGINAYRKVLLGHKTGYLCGLDATASGIQLLSLLAGCQQSASMCNLVYTGNREDTYTAVHDHMNQLLGKTATFARKPVKNATMTHFYGSKAVPRDTFGEDTPELAAFYTTIDDLLPGANTLNHDLINLWQPTALMHEWTLPDGFDVKVKVMGTKEHQVEFLGSHHTVIERVNEMQESGLSMGANIVHSIDGMIVREMGRRCMYDASVAYNAHHVLLNSPARTSTLREQDLALLRTLECFDQSGFMSAVILEHLDAANIGHLSPVHRQATLALIESLPNQPFHLIAIHDCFKFHPNFGNDVRQQYINILAELADSNVLESIASQVTGRQVPVNKLSNNLSTLIRQSEYALS